MTAAFALAAMPIKRNRAMPYSARPEFSAALFNIFIEDADSIAAHLR